MAGARGPCQLQPATAWPARSSLRAAALRRRQTPRRLGARRWGSAGNRGNRGSGVRGAPTSPPLGWCTPSPVPDGGCDSWSGSCGGGAESGCLLFCKSSVGTGLSGLPSEPQCAPPPGLALWAARVAGMRVVARRLPGSPPGGCRAFRESRSSLGAVTDGMTAGAAVFYG